LFQNIWLLLTYNIPILRRAAWQFNRLLNIVFNWLDDLLGAKSKFPVLVYVVARK
jgi:hypothetical protein